MPSLVVRDQILHVTLQNHWIEGFCDYMEGSSSWQGVAIGIVDNVGIYNDFSLTHDPPRPRD